MQAKNYYSTKKIKQLEQLAMQGTATIPAIPEFTLMQRAGAAAFELLRKKYSKAKHFMVLCGAGNNAGDGYVVAALAQEAGFDVVCYYLKDPITLKQPAISAYGLANDAGVFIEPFNKAVSIDDTDVIVDALLGTGIQGRLQEDYLKVIYWINTSNVPVLAIDVPSGLNADSGDVLDCAVEADNTMTFIGIKQGFSTEQAKPYCGELHLNTLGIADEF